MAKVYIVTSGYYSDYEIERVFSTREKAEEWIGPGGEDYKIEEFALDEPGDERIMLVHNVRLDLESGEEIEQRSYALEPFPEKKPQEFRSKVYIRDFLDQWDDGKKNVVAYSSVSREHALKVAVEKRQEWLRMRDLAKAETDA